VVVRNHKPLLVKTHGRRWWIRPAARLGS